MRFILWSIFSLWAILTVQLHERCSLASFKRCLGRSVRTSVHPSGASHAHGVMFIVHHIMCYEVIFNSFLSCAYYATMTMYNSVFNIISMICWILAHEICVEIAFVHQKKMKNEWAQHIQCHCNFNSAMIKMTIRDEKIQQQQQQHSETTLRTERKKNAHKTSL